MSMVESTTAVQDLTGDYMLDPAHTRIGFAARHAMVTKVRGQFRRFEGTLSVDAKDPTKSSATVELDVNSITTGDDQRDAHLRNADFFDVEQHPKMMFKSTAVEKVSGDRYRMTGDLTVKGETRPVSFEVEFTGSAKDPYGNLRAGFEASGELSRKEWGLTWNAALETGGILVSDKIKLEFDVSAVKLTPTP